MADGDLAGAQIAGQASESQTAADISPQVDDQPFAFLLFEVINCSIQRGRKSQSRGAGKIGDLEKSNVLPRFSNKLGSSVPQSEGAVSSLSALARQSRFLLRSRARFRNQ